MKINEMLIRVTDEDVIEIETFETGMSYERPTAALAYIANWLDSELVGN